MSSCFIRLSLSSFVCSILLSACFINATPAAELQMGPDSQEVAEVPKGVVSEHKWNESAIFPGTQRSYWIYLPPAFEANKEYPLIVFQDGSGVVSPKGGFRAPTVMDNLIHKGDIPPMVGLFISPGSVPPSAPGGNGRSTRSFEYDTPNDTYARFLIDEMMPQLAKHARISPNPDDHAIAGVSSGGICAFTVAWFRPDVFRKVITGIGSFTNIQGGVWYPAAIRKTERKPLRIYLQENENDLDNVHGSWPLANKDMAAALTFAGYDLKTTFNDGGHSAKNLGILLPEALRWIWRKDTTLPKAAPEVKNDLALSSILIDGEGWQSVVTDKMFVDAPCSDAEGNFYFSDLGGGTGIHKVATDGTVSVFHKDVTGISGMKWGPDGRLYACHNREKQIIAIDRTGKIEVLATDIGCNDLVVNHKGHIYVTVTGKKQIILIEGAGKIRVVDTGIDKPNGLTLSPDQQTLAVSDFGGFAAWALRVEPNGDLTAKMPVMPYRSFGGVIENKGDGMTCDTNSRWYCSTVSGVQVFDPNGRPAGLILPPVDTPITSVTLSGPNLSYLFLLSKGQVFKRKVNATGLLSFKEPLLKGK